MTRLSVSSQRRLSLIVITEQMAAQYDPKSLNSLSLLRSRWNVSQQHQVTKAPYARKRFPAFLYCLLFSRESRTTSSLLETIQKRRKTFPCVRGPTGCITSFITARIMTVMEPRWIIWLRAFKATLIYTTSVWPFCVLTVKKHWTSRASHGNWIIFKKWVSDWVIYRIRVANNRRLDQCTYVYETRFNVFIYSPEHMHQYPISFHARTRQFLYRSYEWSLINVYIKMHDQDRMLPSSRFYNFKMLDIFSFLCENWLLLIIIFKIWLC